jgi:aminoglycoside 3-N-acetyltransferase
MPAIPNLPSNSAAPIDFDSVPSKAGLVSEVFRRMPGVRRSISNNHSVCALGPNAAFLTDSHHLSTTSWDKSSPYRRIASLPNAWVVGFGVGHGLRAATALHCVESELPDHPYFSRLFKRVVTYSYQSNFYGNGTVTQLVRRGANYSPKLSRLFGADVLIELTECGIDFYAVSATKLVEQSISLGLKGKTMYLWPIPWPWLFRKGHKD